MDTITLGSASPRRLELLKRLDLNVIVKKPEVPEIFNSQIDIIDNGKQIALDKLNFIKDKNPNDNWIISADTFIEVDNKVLGKPVDINEAFTMLKSLSNRDHNVITTVAVYSKIENRTLVEADITRITFENLTDQEIQYYLKFNEWVDAAGAYKIQGKGEILIKSINGSFSSVMGLPINRIYGMLKQLNFNYSGN